METISPVIVRQEYVACSPLLTPHPHPLYAVVTAISQIQVLLCTVLLKTSLCLPFATLADLEGTLHVISPYIPWSSTPGLHTCYLPARHFLSFPSSHSHLSHATFTSFSSQCTDGCVQELFSDALHHHLWLDLPVVLSNSTPHSSSRCSSHTIVITCLYSLVRP